MMSSYYYSYYYCYDYYDYPSYCCCSVLLSVFFFFFFLRMICCTLKHLWSSVFPRKTIQMEKIQPHSQLFASCFGPPDIQHLPTSTETSLFFDHGFHKCGSVTWTWCSLGPTWPFIMTFSPPVHGLCALLIRSLLVYLPLSPHSVIVCSPNKI